MGRAWRRVAAATCAMALAGGPQARAEETASAEQAWKNLQHPGLDRRTLLEHAVAGVPWFDESTAVTDGDVTVHALDEAGRVELAQRTRETLRKTSDALETLGFSVGMSALTVVRVRVANAGPLVAATDDAAENAVVVVREPFAGGPAAGTVAVPKRPDGPPTLRDLVQAGDALRLQGEAGGGPASGPGSLSFALARHAVRGIGLSNPPPWLADGLAMWAEERATPGPTAGPIHVCGGLGGKDGLARLLDPEAPTTVGRARAVARLIAALAPTGASIGERLAAVADSEDRGAATLLERFGEAAAAWEVVAKEISTAGCEGGLVPCGLCKGTRKAEAACPVCSGFGNIACPSCRGSVFCPAAACVDGFQTYEGGKKVRCKYCTRGTVRCRACENQGRAPCRACGGSGRATVVCLGCAGSGRAPCPHGGVAPAPAGAREGATPAPCPWCGPGGLRQGCDGCDGCGYRGCLECEGTTRVLCDRCDGTGEVRMVYEDGTAASASTCKDCEGAGFTRCDACSAGRTSCDACSGKAVEPIDPEWCPCCQGRKTAPDIESSRARVAWLLGRPSAGDLARNGEMVAKAVRFLLGCTDDSGAFVLMKFRKRGEDALVPLEKPTLFSNADVLWTLSVAGIGRDDARVKPAWDFLLRRAKALADSKADEGIQAASLALRALIAGREDPKSPVVTGLVRRLCAAQRADGLWGEDLVGTGKGDPWSSIFPVESLRMASLAGARVPPETWSRALAGALGSFDSIAKSGRRRGWVDGTDVASSTALVVLAKAGTLGNRSANLDAYRAIPAVQRGLAWLDRHFDVREEPVVSSGALVRDGSDAGYAAYLYAIQRLGQLLSIEVLAGERWHSTGARHLATLQRADGSWEEESGRLNGPVRTTGTALLFLLRATPPLTSTGGRVSDGR